ncbi:MAG: tripartite tricarboxylate transporter substrate binding protein [Gemmatimonadaceae bacterium]|nr:tripartite tricarboxylate transporter substrate binding protein [Acetobacteraceae bacterium]
MRRRTVVSSLLSVPLLGVPDTLAQGGRPVRLIVPTAPGGAIDAIGRLYAGRLGARTSQGWVVENRSGANNTVGSALVARAAPDGATLLTNADIHLMAKRTTRSLTYDPIDSFAPVGRMATAPLIIVGHPAKSRATTLNELVEAMRRDPAGYAFATSGGGSMAHLAAEGFKRRIGAPDVLVANYRGTAPALNDVVSGTVTLMVAPVLSAQSLIAGGLLRAFAVTAPSRSAAMPDVPTVDEAGLPGLHFTLWYALWGPRGLPAPLAEALSSHVREIGQEPDISRRLGELGADPYVTDTPSLFAQFLAEEDVRNGRLADEIGIQPE